MLDAPRLDENRIVIPPGGMLLLFSDGLTDGRNQKGEPFGRERLEAALAKLAGLDAQEACDRLLRLLRKFQSTALQDDDMTILAAHSSP
jgi:serine phosphatase RsbU (regulator of sigma subunit)